MSWPSEDDDEFRPVDVVSAVTILSLSLAFLDLANPVVCFLNDELLFSLRRSTSGLGGSDHVFPTGGRSVLLWFV